MSEPFNPNDHLMQIKNKNGSNDYLPVQWRLVWFRELCPDGEITTELVHLDLDRETEEEAYAWNQDAKRSEKIIKHANGIAVFRATVKDGKGGIATGTKSEKSASFPDFIEKAETGAIGRALAALGYGTQFAPELSEDHRIVDAPVDPKPAQKSDKPTTPKAQSEEANSDPAVQRMIDIAKSRVAKIGLDWEAVKQEALKRPVADHEVKIGDFVYINGLITRKEQAAKGAA